jgi:Domain of unknown function (DUF4129)
MKRFGFVLFATLCLMEAPSAHGQVKDIPAQDSSAGSYDLASFTASLQLISSDLEENPSGNKLAELRDSLPANWTVKTSEGEFVISSEFLKDKLKSSVGDAQAKAWTDHVLAEVKSYSSPFTKAGSNARGELDNILAGAEFVSVRPPSAWDLFRQRMWAWIDRLLYKIFGGLERHPIGGQILFWLLILVGVGFVAMWLFRFMVSRDKMGALPGREIVSATRTWQEWIRLAREAAARKDFREAVHSAYWAGIVRLEDTGVVLKDRTKTPREYLKMVAESSRYELAPRPAFKEPLAELTKRLERVWYANRKAGVEDYEATLRQLEAMGCQLE